MGLIIFLIIFGLLDWLLMCNMLHFFFLKCRNVLLLKHIETFRKFSMIILKTSLIFLEILSCSNFDLFSTILHPIRHPNKGHKSCSGVFFEGHEGQFLKNNPNNLINKSFIKLPHDQIFHLSTIQISDPWSSRLLPTTNLIPDRGVSILRKLTSCRKMTSRVFPVTSQLAEVTFLSVTFLLVLSDVVVSSLFVSEARFQCCFWKRLTNLLFI